MSHETLTSPEAKFLDHLETLTGGNDIAAEVAQEILDSTDPTAFLHDLFRHGCITGMVPSLIYYRDTHAFFDRHYAEIEELREQYEENVGQPLYIKNDLRNFLAWYAFEAVAYRLASEWELV